MHDVQRVQFVITDEDGEDNQIQHKIDLIVRLESGGRGKIQATADVPRCHFKDWTSRKVSGDGRCSSAAIAQLFANLVSRFDYLPYRDKTEAERSAQ